MSRSGTSWYTFHLLVMLAGLGCAKQGELEPPRFPVSGTVRLNGQHLPEGEISFRTPSLGLIERIPIKNGMFAGAAVAGERRIEFSFIREVKHSGPKMPGIEAPESLRVETLPSALNTESSFSALVTPEGPNEFTFELSTQ